MNFLDLLSYGFIQRALLAGVISGALLAILGVYVSLRKMAFFSEGIAHASLAGVAIGILLQGEPMIWATIYSILFATAIYYLEKKTRLSADSLIGILFTSSLALGVLLINLKSGYQPDLLSYLFGNILTIRAFDLIAIAIIATLTATILFAKQKQFLLLALNKEMAAVAGLNTELLSYAMYVLLALAVVLGIKVLGIVLVSALLIIPTATAKLFSSNVKSLFTMSVVYAEIAVMIGLAASFLLDLPSGSCIILTGTAIFMCVFLVKSIKTHG